MASLSWRYYSPVRACRSTCGFRSHLRTMAEMALESGHRPQLHLALQIYGPELDKRCRAQLKRTNKSSRVDETYIRIKGRDRCLCMVLYNPRQWLLPSVGTHADWRFRSVKTWLW